MDINDIKNYLKNMNQKEPHITKTICIYRNEPTENNLKKLLDEIEKSIAAMHVFEKLPKRNKKLVTYRYIDGLTVMQTTILLNQDYLNEPSKRKRKKGNYTTTSSIKVIGPQLLNEKIKPKMLQLINNSEEAPKTNNNYFTEETVINILSDNIIDRKKIKKEICWARCFYQKVYLQIKDVIRLTDKEKYNNTKNKIIKKIYGPMIMNLEKVENVKNQLNCLNEKTQQLIIAKYVYKETDITIAETYGYPISCNGKTKHARCVPSRIKQAIEQITEMCNIEINRKSSFKEDLIA